MHRSQKRLSATCKSFSSDVAVWHLIGGSIRHAVDALQSEQWQDKNHREELLAKVPVSLKQSIRALLDHSEAHRNQYHRIQREGLAEAGWSALQTETLVSFTALDLESDQYHTYGSKLLVNLGFEGLPGKRTWRVLDAKDWAVFIKGEMAYRADYRTADRHPPKERKEELYNFYFRLPPWLAEVVGDKLEAADDGVQILTAIAVEFAKAFGKESGVDVVGVAVHREKSGDLHFHLIFSLTRERLVTYDLSKREKKALIQAMTEARIAERRASGNPTAVLGRNRVRREIEKEVKNNKKVVVERVRGRHPRPFQILGPSFRGKLALWELSGRDEAIASMGDRPVTESKTFRGRVSEPTKKGADLSKTFIDLWGERWICTRFAEILTDDEREEVRVLGLKALANYRSWGKENPAIEDYILAQVKALEPPGSSFEEIEALRRKDEDLKQLETILDDSPAEFKVGGVLATAKAIVAAAKQLAAIKAALAKLWTFFPAVMKAVATNKTVFSALKELKVVARALLGKEDKSASRTEISDGPADP